MATQDVLFIAPTRIGDAVLASSLLAHVLATSPAARVTIITSPLAAPLYQGYPLLAQTIPLTKRSYSRHWIEAWRATRHTRWHSIWDVRGSVLSYILRAGERHIFHSSDDPIPKVNQYEQALGTGPLPYPVLWPRAEDTAAAEALMAGDTRYLVFAPIANWPPKEWPIASFITLASMLLEGCCRGYRPVVICAAHERERARPMLEALAPYHPLDLTEGKAPLLTVYACMQRAHGFVGNDSGLMHLAAAAGIPTLGLFGPTPSAIYQPWGSHVAFIQAERNDLGALDPTNVVESFARLLACSKYLSKS